MPADFDGGGLPDLATTDIYAANMGIPGTCRGPFVALNDGNWTVLTSVTISDATVLEGNTGTRAANFTVTLSKAWDQPVTVAYATAADTVAAGSDFQAASGTPTIPAARPAERYPCWSTATASAREMRPSLSTSAPRPTRRSPTARGSARSSTTNRRFASAKAVTEGNTGRTSAMFTITHSAAYDMNVTVDYFTGSNTATAESDFVATTGTVTFAPGETSKTITIEVKGDSEEANEYFSLDQFGNSTNSLFTWSRGTGTILNDD